MSFTVASAVDRFRHTYEVERPNDMMLTRRQTDCKTPPWGGGLVGSVVLAAQGQKPPNDCGVPSHRVLPAICRDPEDLHSADNRYTCRSSLYHVEHRDELKGVLNAEEQEPVTATFG